MENETELLALSGPYDEIMDNVYGVNNLLPEDDFSGILEAQLLIAYRLGYEEAEDRIKQELEAKWGEY